MNALQWMGAVRMRVQTADKNITIIHNTPVHQLTSWDKNWNKSRIKMLCFWLKCESIMHNNAPSCYLLHQNPSTYLFQAIFGFLNTAWSVQISLLIHRWLFHWRKQCFVYRTLIYQQLDCFFCLLQMLTDGLEWCGSLWCFDHLFGLSFWRHPFTAEHPLLSKWWKATFLQIWSSSKLILDGLKLFGWTIPLKE